MNQLSRNDALVSLAVLAARADEAGDAAEREELERLTSTLAAKLPGGADRSRLAEYVEVLRGPETRREAYAAALAVCRADGKLSRAERDFLRLLGQALELPKGQRRHLRHDADALLDTAAGTLGPAPAEGSADELVNDLIRRTAILAGALELLPQTLGTVGIVGLQIRMVKRIARHYGQDPRTSAARDFLAAAGVGLAGQALEIYVRRAASELGERGFLGRLAGRLAGPGFTFATTYALGQLAQRHYSGDQPLDAGALRGAFADLFQGARQLAADSEDAIRHRAAGFGISDLAGLLRR